MKQLFGLLFCAAAIALPVHAVDAAPGPDAKAAPGSTANQSAFPYYYNAGMPSSDDLVLFADPPAAGGAPSPAPPPDALGANQGALPGVYDSARLAQTRETLDSEIGRARAALALIRACDGEDDDREMLDLYSDMPPFGDNAIINACRADAANLLILALCRRDKPDLARELYRAIPYDIPGDDAMLAKARAIINLTTHLVRDERYNDAYSVLMDVGRIKNREALNPELFRLMARMIPYLDNADETDKAHRVYTLLLEQVRSLEAAALFAENLPSLGRYFLTYASRAATPERRALRLDFMNRVLESLEPFLESREVARVRTTLAAELVDFHAEAGDRERARHYYDIMRRTDSALLPEK